MPVRLLWPSGSSRMMGTTSSPSASSISSRRLDARRSSLGVASSALWRTGGMFIVSSPSRADPFDATDLLLHAERDPMRLTGLLEPVLGAERIPVPHVGG